MNVVVTGAGGAIGGHLVKALLFQGHTVRAVDIKAKRDWWQTHSEALNIGELDLRNKEGAVHVLHGAELVYHLAEDMGGIGFITNNRVECAESIEIGISMLRASVKNKVQRFFFSSSACVYNTDLQNYDPNYRDAAAAIGDAPALREVDAWPAKPEEGYGHSKLYMEELCRHYQEERGLEVRIARYHNVYGPPSSWNDGREKAPAAIARKVAEAVVSGRHEIEIWGDGKQMRSYLYVSDCVVGSIALMSSLISTPVNIGSTESISVDQLVSIMESHAGVTLERKYVSGATGVAARNADITLAKQELEWEPKKPLVDGLGHLYQWVYEQVKKAA